MSKISSLLKTAAALTVLTGCGVERDSTSFKDLEAPKDRCTPALRSNEMVDLRSLVRPHSTTICPPARGDENPFSVGNNNSSGPVDSRSQSAQSSAGMLGLPSHIQKQAAALAAAESFIQLTEALKELHLKQSVNALSALQDLRCEASANNDPEQSKKLKSIFLNIKLAKGFELESSVVRGLKASYVSFQENHDQEGMDLCKRVADQVGWSKAFEKENLAPFVEAWKSAPKA